MTADAMQARARRARYEASGARDTVVIAARIIPALAARLRLVAANQSRAVSDVVAEAIWHQGRMPTVPDGCVACDQMTTAPECATWAQPACAKCYAKGIRV